VAVHYEATIVPTKMELLQTWVPRQPWLGDANASKLTKLGSYRFDDPDGEVGIETHLLGTADGQILQVPLTYRGAPVESADEWLITTMTHTTLGDRWIYDGCHDPVYVRAVVTTILTGGRDADLFLATDTGLVQESVTTHVLGSGTTPTTELPDLSAPVVTHEHTVTRIDAGPVVTLLRVPTTGTAETMLTGTWPGQPTPLLLATIAAGPGQRKSIRGNRD
jgi:maltokinase-like protein